MANTKQIIENQLNTLLTRNYDAEAGFNKVAKEVTDKSLETYLLNKASERKAFGYEIKDELKSIEGEINKGTSLEGDMHRAWIDVKSVVGKNDVESMLDEILRGEKVAVEEYEKVIENDDILLSTKEVLQRQKDQINYTRSATELMDEISA